MHIHVYPFSESFYRQMLGILINIIIIIKKKKGSYHLSQCNWPAEEYYGLGCLLLLFDCELDDSRRM